ncbi:ethanolamine ammonia-lyase reactivating factor EutA [Haloferacaceae archaeon DSL9]
MSTDSTTELTSVGIDVGTTTTHLVVSRLALGSTGSSDASKVTVTDREVVYRGRVHETPLLDSETVDVDGVAAIVADELERAGVSPTDIDTGAVIVTGETATKRNAEPLAHRLATDAGAFVVATAGAALEAILAGKGSGTAGYAADSERAVANVDVGGGTTNAAIFGPDGVRETRCLDIGGRLVRLDGDGRVTRISPSAARVADDRGLDLAVGDAPPRETLVRLADAMAEIVVDSLRGPPFSPLARALAIGSLPDEALDLDAVVVTGGVGRLLAEPGDPFAYGDLGPLLAIAIGERARGAGLRVVSLDEDIRATVIGAGTRTTELSGRTLWLDESLLPLRNLPIGAHHDLRGVAEADLERELSDAVETCQTRYDPETVGGIGLALSSVGDLSYGRLSAVAAALASAVAELPADVPFVVVVEDNCAKALGQLLAGETEPSRPLLVVDELVVGGGDYLDVGTPLGDDDTVPVVVKTLVFGG